MTSHPTDPRPHYPPERTALFTTDSFTATTGSADHVVYPPTRLPSRRPVYRVTHLPRRRPSARSWLAGFAVLLAVAASGLVWLTVLAVLSLIAAVTAAIAWVQAHWLLCVLAALAVFALLTLLRAAGGGSGCAGLHCGGCDQ